MEDEHTAVKSSGKQDTKTIDVHQAFSRGHEHGPLDLSNSRVGGRRPERSRNRVPGPNRISSRVRCDGGKSHAGHQKAKPPSRSTRSRCSFITPEAAAQCDQPCRELYVWPSAHPRAALVTMFTREFSYPPLDEDWKDIVCNTPGLASGQTRRGRDNPGRLSKEPVICNYHAYTRADIHCHLCSGD